jgi:hypothetical protein
MLSVTFLGHQGWVIQTKTACLLVDPLLYEEFGESQALDYQVYPPRALKTAEFPRIDAVVLTHEHDDHFDIPSLSRLDRKIPVFLSSRSSTAARQILGEMGFSVNSLSPGSKLRLGDLELIPSCGDHLSFDYGDEWDALPFFVRDTGGSGNFFSMVDVTLTEQHVDWARAQDPRPVVVSWTNNALDWSHMADYLPKRTNATQESFMQMGVGHKIITTKWGVPHAMAICAGGFSFRGERAWLNQQVFCVDTEAVCAMMSRLYRSEQFLATRPGQTFFMEGHRLKKVLDAAPFLSTTPVETWPSRAPQASPPASDYAPATGHRTLSAEERGALPMALEELAGALMGGTTFKGLYSLVEGAAPGHVTTFALVLRDGEDRLIYEYVPAGCTFVPGREDPHSVYLAGVECWATDFLAVLRGELGPIALNFGRARAWNALPQHFRFDPFSELFRMSHPLRRPAAYLSTYRKLWSASKDTAPAIFAR